jgi:hypothetical protein
LGAHCAAASSERAAGEGSRPGNGGVVQRGIGLALVGVGIVLLVLGINAADSFSSSVSRFFTGNPTDRSVWLMIGGVALLLLGAGVAFIPGRGLKNG